jgi:tRNA pseudouridine(55) synthase
MNGIILTKKHLTETMGTCLERIRQEQQIPRDVRMTYAGRLDPMASGLVIFLCGSARFHKDLFLSQSKSYTVTFFLGYQTDTYDVLGIPKKIPDAPHVSITDTTIRDFRPIGIFSQAFPAFSSRKVFGKPLFLHARENIIPVPVVTHEVKIDQYSQIESQSILTRELLENIQQQVGRVVGDFRQTEIIKHWQHYSNTKESTTLYTLSLDVSHGFYVRQWVHDLGTYLTTCAVTYAITRTRIGNFTQALLQDQSSRFFDINDPQLKQLTDNYPL